MVGEAGGEGHIWNTITFDDGNTFCVDVTWGDHGFGNLNSYIYFNAPIEIMQETHKWDWSLAPANLQPSVDDCYSYCYLGSHLARANNVEAELKLIAQKLKERNGWFSIIVPFDGKYADDKVMQPAMQKVTNESGKRFVYAYWQRGKYMFIHTRTY